MRISTMRNYNSENNTRCCKACQSWLDLSSFKTRIKTLKGGEQVINYREVCNICSIAKLKTAPKKTSEQRLSNHKLDPRRVLLNSARSRAKERGLDFDLTKKDITIPDMCPLLEIPIMVMGGKVTANSPSIDRVNNSKGYVKDNVMVISHQANTCKNSLSDHQLRIFAKNILRVLDKSGELMETPEEDNHEPS